MKKKMRLEKVVDVYLLSRMRLKETRPCREKIWNEEFSLSIFFKIWKQIEICAAGNALASDSEVRRVEIVSRRRCQSQ